MIYYLKRYLKQIIVTISVIIILIGGYVYYESKNNVSTETIVKQTELKKEITKENNLKTVFVDVKGAVNSPGVYEMDEGRRIIDAINLAGGLKDNADTINLNLSKKLMDEMYIIVYSKDELYNYKKNKESKNEVITCASLECDCPDISNDACISKENIILNKENNKISINTATKDMLLTISGIGESKADAIVSYRLENGDFKNLEEIKNVSGIGDALYEKIKDKITL